MKIYRFILVILASLSVLSCVKEDFAMMSAVEDRPLMSPAPVSEAESGLVCDDDGNWVAKNCRVPLVGAGRIVGDILGDLVSVSGTNKGMNNIIDLELGNYAEFPALGVSLLGKELFTVKDMYRTYSKNQEAGFVIGSDENKVLSLSVLSLFVITAYKDNNIVGTYEIGSGDENNVLDLDLVKVSTDARTGIQTLSVKVDADFDEIALSLASAANVELSSETIRVYYAFVGDNPVEYIYSDGTAGSPSIRKDDIWNTGWTNVLSEPEAILDSSDDDGVIIYTGDLITGLVAVRNLTVDFGNMDIEAGSEIGFTYSRTSLANLDLFSSISLIPYDDGWNELDDQCSVKGLLGLNLLGGGTGAYSLVTTTDRTKALRIHFGGLAVKLEFFKLLRVYKRNPVKADPTSYFTADREVVTSRASYRFMDPLTDGTGTPYGTLSLTIEDRGGETVDADNPTAATIDGNRIIGMHRGVTYTVKSVFTANDGRSFSMTTKITREDEPSSDIHFMSGDGYVLASGSRSNGVINLIPNLQNGQNLVSESLEDAAVYTKVLSLIDYSVIAAVETADGSKIVPDGEVRVGFAVQPTSDFLSLTALDFFRIVLYNGDEEVETYVPAENQTVSLGLLSGSSGKIAITALTDQPFDRVELQTAGVLTLELSSMRLYYAFYEKTNGNHNSDSGIGDVGIELMTYASHGLNVDYDVTGFSGIKVANTLSKFDYMLDSDKSTGMLANETASVAASMTIAARFDPVESRQWIGMIVRNPSGVLDASVISDMTFEVYNDGILMETVSQQSGLLGLQLVGYGDSYYIEAYPTAGSEFDEVRILKRSLVNLMDDFIVYGIYIRADENHNGIPDDSEDGSDDDDTDDYMFAVPSVYHICSPADLTISVTGGSKGTGYDLWFTSAADASQYAYRGVVLSDKRTFVISADAMSGQGMGYGLYSLTIVPADTDPAAVPENYPSDVEVSVHAPRTTWLGGDASASRDVTDWNEWANWSDGVPWTCTDVLIPGGCPSYPVIEGNAKSSETNFCNNLQFGDGGEIVGTQYLSYNKAWVNFSLPGGRYTLFSSPLKETCTGDMFVSVYKDGYLVEPQPDYEHSWLTYDESSYPSRNGARFTPKVYQRVWNRAVENVTVSGSEPADLDDELWSEPFNGVADPYEAGKGILVRPGDEGESGDYVFCLPKAHTEYCYYDLDSRVQYDNLTEYVTRTTLYSGRFIYEDGTGDVTFPYHVLLTNERPSDTYLAGNPFMCHLCVAKFKEFNPAVKSVLVYGYSESTGRYEFMEMADDAQIAPMQGFLVKVGGIYAETSRFRLNIHFMPQMMEAGR